ncbi:MAG: hypothetical protein LLG02_13420 [Pelosinus sp.]|nr:hypothetical protein [Pelosinus sp.]
MKNFLALISLEIKLTLRTHLFWILAGLTVVSILLPVLTLLLGQFILIHLFTRDQRTNFSSIMCSLPHSSEKLYLARISAALLLLLALWPFMLGILLFFPEMQLAEWSNMPSSIIFLTLKYLILCLTQIGLVLLCTIITKQLAWLYLLSIVCWLKTSDLASNLGFLPSFSQLFVLGQGFMLPSAPSLASGYFPQQILFSGVALFQAGLALLFAASAIIQQMRLRRERLLGAKTIIVFFLLSLAFLCLGSRIALTELAHREHWFDHLIQASSQRATTAQDQGYATFSPEAYQLAVKLKTTAHYFAGTARIKGKISALPSHKMQLTLRDSFTVTAVNEITADKPLQWTQNGAILTIYLPDTYQENTELMLAISYSGEIREWFPARMARPNGPVNFIDPAYSLLRSGYAWYPIPGLHHLYTYYDCINPLTDRTETTLRAKPVLQPPTKFTMTVDIDTDNLVASNLEQTGAEALSGEYKERYHFYSAEGHDVFLLAGPYEHQVQSTPDGKISIYSLPLHKQQITRFINSFKSLYSVYDTMLEENPSYTVVEIPPFLLFSEDGQPLKNLTLTDTIVLSENYFKTKSHTLDFLNQVRNNKHDLAILQRWWQEDLTEGLGMNKWGNGNINTSLSYYLYLVGLEKTRAPESYLQAKQNIQAGQSVLLDDFCAPSLPLSPITREVFLVLDSLRIELGDQALKKVMRPLYRLHKTQGAIQPSDFSQAVEATLTSSTLSPVKQAEIRGHLLSIEELSANPKIFTASTSITQFSFDMEEYLP